MFWNFLLPKKTTESEIINKIWNYAERRCIKTKSCNNHKYSITENTNSKLHYEMSSFWIENS